MAWPGYSPNLTLCDYFLWGYIKDKVYRDPPRVLKDLKNKIRQEVRNIDRQILWKVYRNMETRLNFVMREHGGRFEHLIN